MQRTPSSRLGLAPPLIAWLLLLLAALLEPKFGYNRWWDNFEYCTPVIWEAHSQWLHGMVPHWNPHQHLGEPFTLAMLAGVFYFPYTLCCLLVRLCGLPASALPTAIVVLHTAFAAVGWDRLLRFFEVRPAIRVLVSASAALSGFATCVSTVWIFASPLCAWLPWLLYAAVWLLRDPWRFRPLLLLVVGLTALLFIGHVQFALYAWLFVAVFSAGYATLVLRRPKHLLALAIAAAMAVMAAAPFWLPASLYLKYTAGLGRLPLAEFLIHPASLELLKDVLLPVYSHFNGFLSNPVSIYGHQGSWVAPAILGGLMVLWRRGAPKRGDAPAADPLVRPFLLSLGCAALFFILSLGARGHLLRLTYGLPLWSSLRGAFKFLPFSLAAVALSAGLGLEICWREPNGARWRKALGFGLAAVAAALVAANVAASHDIVPPLRTWSGVLALAAGLVVMPALLLGVRSAARRLALAAAFVQLAAFVVLCHHQEMERYHVPYGVVGPVRFGIDNRYRVMPLSSVRSSHDAPMEEYAVYHSATANGYFSATGHHTRYLLPRWYETWLPVDEMGLLPSNLKGILAGSNLLRSANVRYYVVAKWDVATLHAVASKPGMRLVRELQDTCVYEDAGALPRLYFATAALPYSDREAHDFLNHNNRPSTAAIVEGWTRPASVAMGEVLQTDWDDAVIRAVVRAPQGGFLVASTTWYPGWTASVDGRPALVYRVNGTLLGMDVPPGSRDVALRFTPSGWRRSLGLATIGLLGLVVSGVASVRRRASSGAPR